MSPVRTGRDGRAPARFFADWADDQHDQDPPATPSPRRERTRRRLRSALVGTGAVVTVGAIAAGTLLAATTAQADPSSTDWYRLRMCESSNNYSINTGNGYYGAYQFDLGTWQSVGGHGYPNQASAGEQDARALILYRLRGWQPWTCAGIVGLREDSDARSGRISDIHVPGSGSTGGGGTTPGVPAYPSSVSYSYGDSSSTIARFQLQMHKRGATQLTGSGQYGPLTKTVVIRLQQLNGINPSGLLGPLTWHAAFAGKWSNSGSSGTPAAPAYPSSRLWFYGNQSSTIARFQLQMKKRGVAFEGTGQFGSLTQSTVKRLQSLNGINPSGVLGPLTWRAAFIGTWSNP